MSRQNKVNPGMYTQRGRLTQDDAARELRKQSASGSPHTWQPVNTKKRPRLAPVGDAARDTERSADNDAMVETSPHIKTRAGFACDEEHDGNQGGSVECQGKSPKG